MSSIISFTGNELSQKVHHAGLIACTKDKSIVVMDREDILQKILDLLDKSSINDIRWTIRRIEERTNVYITSPSVSACELSDGPLSKT